MSTPTPPAVDHKRDSAILAAYQKAFAAAATLPAIVGITHKLLKGSDLWVGVSSTVGISFFAAFSLIATGRGLRSELLAENCSRWKAEFWSWLLIIGGVVAMLIALAYPF